MKTIHSRPLIESELPLDLRGLYDFSSQEPRFIAKYNRMTIVRTCKKCNLPQRILVSTVRQNLQQNSLTGRCGNCARLSSRPPQPKLGNAHNWKGGRFIRQGYVIVRKTDHPFACNGYVLEHRLVMEKHLGRYLSPNEQIHHKNGIKSDNRIENLELWIRNHGDGKRYEDMSPKMI